MTKKATSTTPLLAGQKTTQSVSGQRNTVKTQIVLAEMPVEVLQHIASYLLLMDMAVFLRVSKAIKAVIEASPTIYDIKIDKGHPNKATYGQLREILSEQQGWRLRSFVVSERAMSKEVTTQSIIDAIEQLHKTRGNGLSAVDEKLVTNWLNYCGAIGMISSLVCMGGLCSLTCCSPPPMTLFSCLFQTCQGVSLISGLSGITTAIVPALSLDRLKKSVESNECSAVRAVENIEFFSKRLELTGEEYGVLFQKAKLTLENIAEDHDSNKDTAQDAMALNY